MFKVRGIYGVQAKLGFRVSGRVAKDLAPALERGMY